VNINERGLAKTHWRNSAHFKLVGYGATTA
jgi:hypothetical protein